MTTLWQKLRGLLGAEFVPGVDLGQFAVDGVEPQVLVRLQSREDIARFTEWANTHFYAIIPWGGGTRMSMGNVPRKYEIALSLARLNRVVEHTPEDMTVTVEAGMGLGELQRQLARHGQFLPVEAPDSATLGGIIAANAYGPSRLAWGMIRDWLIGIRFVRADGKLVHGGGKVVKNVAGYDLCKLLVGSYGTLGIIVEATFKVAPLPEARYACITNSTHLPLIHASPVRPQFLDLLDSRACRDVKLEGLGDDTIVLGVSGTREEADWQVGQLATKQVHFDPATLTRFGESDEVVLRFVGKPSQVNQLRKQLAEAFDGHLKLTAHVDLCVFRCAVPDRRDLAETIQRFRSVGYQVVVERAPARLKNAIDTWGDPGPSLALMKKVKHEFDERHILNPGRFVGGI